MSLEVGKVYEGKVTGITSFGAFVSLPERHSGLVHISEIANTYVNDINQFLKIGQDVKVRLLSMSDDGKINLSIKKAQESMTEPMSKPERQGESFGRETRSMNRIRENASGTGNGRLQSNQETNGDEDFETRLKRFMKESDSRIADNRLYADHRQRNRRR